MNLGEKLKDLLEIRNIPQKELAANLNIAPTTLNGYINNKRQPDYDTLKRMATYLNISIDYLLDHSTIDSISPREQDLVFKLRALDPSQKELIIDLVYFTYKKHKSCPIK